jgi:hypothetical protein
LPVVDENLTSRECDPLSRRHSAPEPRRRRLFFPPNLLLQNKRFKNNGEEPMNFLIRLTISILGGSGAIAVYHEKQDLVLPAVIVVVIAAAFILACVWSFLKRR